MCLKHIIATCHHWPFSAQAPTSVSRVCCKDGCFPGGGTCLHRFGVSHSHRCTGWKAREPLATPVVQHPGEEPVRWGVWQRLCFLRRKLQCHRPHPIHSGCSQTWIPFLLLSGCRTLHTGRWLAPSMRCRKAFCGNNLKCLNILFLKPPLSNPLAWERSLLKTELVVTFVERLSGVSFVLIMRYSAPATAQLPLCLCHGKDRFVIAVGENTMSTLLLQCTNIIRSDSIHLSRIRCGDKALLILIIPEWLFQGEGGGIQNGEQPLSLVQTPLGAGQHRNTATKGMDWPHSHTKIQIERTLFSL